MTRYVARFGDGYVKELHNSKKEYGFAWRCVRQDPKTRHMGAATGFAAKLYNAQASMRTEIRRFESNGYTVEIHTEVITPLRFEQ